MDFQFLNLNKFPKDNDFLIDIINQLPHTTRAIEVGAYIGRFTKLILEQFENALIIEGEETNYKNLLTTFPQYKTKIINHVVYNDNNEHDWYYANEDWGNALIMPLDESRTKHMTKTKVKSVTLDSIDFNFDFIKTDCEGADLKILMGAKRLIKKNRPLIYFEHSGEIGASIHNYTEDTFFNFFKKLDYTLFLANGEKFLSSTWRIDTKKEFDSCNILAIPNQKLDT